MSKNRYKGPAEGRENPDAATVELVLVAVGEELVSAVSVPTSVNRAEYHFRFPHNLLPGGVQVFSFRHYPTWTVQEVDGWIWFQAPAGGGRSFRVPVSSIAAIVEG